MRNFHGVLRRIDSAFMIIVLMGVSGSGKSTVGRLLAGRLGWRFCEGDEFHPRENVEKMSNGIALTDGDRLPWLARIKNEIDACSGQGTHAVWACSALRRRYRQLLGADISEIHFVYLKGDREVLLERMAARRDHYMKVDMLDSQLGSLEEPDVAIMADIRSSPQDIVSHIVRELGLVASQR